MDQVEQGTANRVVRGLLSGQHVVHVGQDLVEQTDQLIGRLRHLLDLHHRGHRLRLSPSSRLNGLGAQLQTDHLRLVRRHVDIDWGEHATLLAIRDTQTDANERLQTHSAALQRRVHGDVHGVVALTGVVLVNDGAVVRHLIAGGPPAWKDLEKETSR